MRKTTPFFLKMTFQAPSQSFKNLPEKEMGPSWFYDEWLLCWDFKQSNDADNNKRFPPLSPQKRFLKGHNQRMESSPILIMINEEQKKDIYRSSHIHYGQSICKTTNRQKSVQQPKYQFLIGQVNNFFFVALKKRKNELVRCSWLANLSSFAHPIYTFKLTVLNDKNAYHSHPPMLWIHQV